jgi:predicted transcriptional regulator of viral defense system
MADKGRPEGRHGTLAALATRQHGVVSARRLQELGYSRDQISDAAASGRLQRLHRGVYAVGHRHLPWHGRCLAAVIASAPALASHRSAARLWGLVRHKPGTIDITAPTRRRPKQDIQIHNARPTACDKGTVAVVPFTSVPRTLLDLAGTLRPQRLERVIERSEELRLFDLAAARAWSVDFWRWSESGVTVNLHPGPP